MTTNVNIAAAIALTLTTWVGLAAIGLAIWSATSNAAEAAATPRSEIVISDERVHLGDLFDGLDPGKAGVPIAHSPATGREVVLDNGWVIQLIQAHGIDLDDTVTDLPRMTVRRETAVLSDDAIVDAIRVALVEENPGYATDRLEITMDRLPTSVHVSGTQPPEVTIFDLSVDRSSGRFTGRAAIGIDDTDRQSVSVSGRVRSMVAIPVLARRVGNQSVISHQDLDFIEVDAMQLTSGIVFDPEAIVGMTPRRGITPNTPIRDHDLTPPLLVSRGDRITMVVQNGPLVLTAQGRALENGARGQMIRVMNIDSNQTVDGVVEDDGRIRVVSGTGTQPGS